MASRRNEEDASVLEPLNPTSGSEDGAAAGPVGRFAVRKVDDGAGPQPDVDIELGRGDAVPEENDGVPNGNSGEPEIQGFVNAKGKTGFCL